ncbi:MAG: Na+/H+ antiporter subunit E [Alphaproteobacteria bacterium]|nr:Na+/H+ antiporter subunit E [Alphaproteobacteria bacterium]
MAHRISLFVSLATVWLLLSGHYTGLLLTLGAASCVVVIAISHRMDVIDHESHPIHLGWRLPGYWLWLLAEIVKANIDVARRVVDPSLPIDPRLFEVPAHQKTDLGRVIYANSITLTPGTLSTDVSRDKIQVHALSGAGEDDLRTGTMDAKVCALEGNS